MKKDFDQQIATAQKHLQKLKGKNAELEKLIADAAVEQARLDSLLNIKQRPIHKTVIVKNSGGGEALQKYEEDIFYMSAVVCVAYSDKVIPLETTEGGYLGWTGTGYLLWWRQRTQR